MCCFWPSVAVNSVVGDEDAASFVSRTQMSSFDDSADDAGENGAKADEVGACRVDV